MTTPHLDRSALPPLAGPALASALALGLLAARAAYFDSPTYRFLTLNLALAWIPLLLGAALVHAAGRPGRRLWVPVLGLWWLLFLPNAPYLMTDLIHLRRRDPVPYWYDIAMLSMFGYAGVILGVRSLAQVHALVADAWGRALGWAFAGGVAGLVGLGIYLGRELRWNSWDVATRPEVVLADVLGRALSPREDPALWAFTLVFGACFFALYAGFVDDGRRNTPATAPARSPAR